LERGQTIPLFALFLTVMLAGTAFVVDIGGAYGQGRTQQKVADVAALAGATAESNGAAKSGIIAAAKASALANGYADSEVTVNIPPTSGAYAPSGSLSGTLSTNDCSTPALYPCWVEVVISRQHANTFAAVVGQGSWNVSERGVAVGGIANAVTNGLSPIMFNYAAVTAPDSATDKSYCMPQNVHCPPNSTWPMSTAPVAQMQFAWTDFCIDHPENCNVDSNGVKTLINGGGEQFQVWLGMYLGPNNTGGHDSVCKVLQDKYPTGADLPVAISNDNGQLVGFWIWHFDPSSTVTSCTADPNIGGSFVNDVTKTFPLTINPNGKAATFGEYVVSLVE
jgi:hypothetical protein